MSSSQGFHRSSAALYEGIPSAQAAGFGESSVNRSRERGRRTEARRGPGIKLLAYLEMVRPHNVVAAVLCVVLGILASSKAVERALDLADTAVASAVVALVSAGGYVINDYFDYGVDLVNKPHRPIPSGRVGLREALYSSLVLGVVGVALSAWFGPLSLAYVLMNALLVYGYSAKIKEWGIVGNVVVSLEGCAAILYGSLVVYVRTGELGALSAAATPTAIAFALLLGREIVKTIEDYYADSVRGVRSLPRTIGLRRSAVVASAILMTVPALSILPLFSGIYNVLAYAPLAVVTVAVVVASALRIARSSNVVLAAIRVRSALKVAMVTGIFALLLSLLL